jgi:hypothetical protein
MVELAKPSGLLVEKKRKECISAAQCDARNRVQQRAWKYDCAAERRLEFSRPVFRKAQIPAVKIRIQVDGNGEATMGGAQCGVVSVRAKMPPVLGRIAANDMSLRSSCLETIVLQYFRSDASLNKCIYLSDQPRIIDNVIFAALKGVVFKFDCLAAYLAHHSELPTSITSIAVEKLVAKIPSEHVGQIEYRGLKFDTCKTAGWWKVSQMFE